MTWPLYSIDGITIYFIFPQTVDLPIVPRVLSGMPFVPDERVHIWTIRNIDEHSDD
jgi:hypothetical protein